MLAEIAAPYLNRLGEELRRTWIFLEHLAGQTPIRVILMGGGAALKRSADIVRGSMPVPTEVWMMPQGATADRSGPASAPFGPALALAGLTRNR